MTLLAFIGMSLAWSFSWFAMKLQVDSFVAPEISLFYRFFAVAILMIILCAITKTRLKPFRTEWKYFIFIALTNFCLNFIIGYHTTKYIPSGMIAVIFSLSIITSEIFKALFDGKKIEKKIVLSSFFGFLGLLFFIFPNLKFDKNSQIFDVVFGISLAILMMIVFSFGNYLVEKNKRQNHTPLFTAIAFGSSLSSIYLLLINFALGNKFIMDFSTKYIGSLLYQIFFASIVAFLCFYYLIQKVGAVKANYTALIYPTIALIISSFFENFEFTIMGCAGLALILLALALEFMPKKFIKIF
jgi:drug/metabolite transporter (DMT)-like permease